MVSHNLRLLLYRHSSVILDLQHLLPRRYHDILVAEGSLDSAVDAACVDQLLRHSLVAGTGRHSPARNHCRNHYCRNLLAHTDHSFLEVGIVVVGGLARTLAPAVGQRGHCKDVEVLGSNLDRMPFWK